MKRSWPQICWMSLALFLAAACGSGGNDGVIDLNPDDGLPVEWFEGMDAADLNNDGLIDIVAASRFSSGTGLRESRLNAFLQDPANPGTFLARRITVHQEGADIWQVTAADLTLDGVPEILIKSIEFDGFALFEPDPANAGQFLPPRRFGSDSGFRPGSADAFSVGDIDGDQYADVVVTAGEQIFLFRQDATTPGNFDSAKLVAEGTGQSVIGDVDGDGLNDLVTFVRHPNNDGLGVDDGWRLHRQDTSSPASFRAPMEYIFGSAGWAIGAADLDGDGRLDVAVNSSRGNNVFLDIYLQTAFGDFASLPRVAIDVNGILGDQAVADLDGDGRPEIVSAMNTAALDPQLIQIYSQDTGTSYRPDTLLTIPYPEVGQPFLYSLRIADMNADDQPDIVVTTDEVFVFFQRTGSPGSFLPPTRVAAKR